MRGEREGQAEHGRKLRTERARAEDPERHLQPHAGHGADRLVRLHVAEQRLQLQHVMRKILELVARSRRSARAVNWSVPGARPSPRSIRPGKSDSSVPNCSAMISGEWFGSMIPPEPTRIVLVPPATCPITTDVAALAMPVML